MQRILGVDLSGEYEFSPENKTVTFIGVSLIPQQILKIVNLDKNLTIYDCNIHEKSGILLNNVLTLIYDTSQMDSNDLLQIFIWDEISDTNLPPGGLQGQALVKKSDADFDYEYKTLTNNDVYIVDSIPAHSTKTIDTISLENIGILQYLCKFTSFSKSRDCVIDIKKNLINVDYSVLGIIGEMKIKVDVYSYGSLMILSIQNDEDEGIIVNIVKKNLVF